ncbi:MAG: oxidoreductase [Cyanobacteria bacterium P01_D01_bin.50]
MEAKNTKVWLITGTSTGLGRALAEAVLEYGDRAVITARKLEQIEALVARYPTQALAVRLDITQLSEVQAAVEQAIATFGRIDVLVNNAGYGVTGGIEEVGLDLVRQQYETNVFGSWKMIQAVLPHMRKMRSGNILNISSVVGMVSYPGMGVYSSSKFALEGMSEALAQEIAPLGINLTIVEPGAFRTAFNGNSLMKSESAISDYGDTVAGFHQWLKEVHGEQPGDPSKAAQAMIQVVESKNPPLRLPLGADAIEGIEAKLQAVRADIDAWREVAINTAYEGVTIGTVGG